MSPRISLLVSLTLLFAAPSWASPQKVSRKYTEYPSQGFKFKALKDFEAVPAGGMGDDDQVFKFSDDQDEIRGYAFATPTVESDDESGDDDDPRTRAAGKRRSIDTVVNTFYGYEKAAEEPTLDETLEVDGVEVRRKRVEWVWQDNRGKDSPRFIEIWSYPLKHADIHIVYFALEEFDSRWEKAIERSGESFEQIERVVLDEIDISERTYASQLEWAEREAAKTEGWRAIGTPSERFVILTNAEKDRFVDDVIERLEISRDIYERDFPPPDDFKAVSVVRICKDVEEFQKFSGMGGGTAGYFSPASVELVLYDAVNLDRNMTFAVVSHEAFHQYCHFLFCQSEAHRWFDEGHGDYYGGLEITGQRGKITPTMPAGLNRETVIREMIREGTTVPLDEHLNYSHREWQSNGVPSYAQSWSIVYMLRQGMLRNVSRKVWKKEYADIIPNYVETLTKGYRDLYDGILAEREEKAKKAGRELTPEERRMSRRLVDPRMKEKIWKDAMEASWGQIDLKEFEANWKEYVEKHLD